MGALLWTVPALPCAGFVILAFGARRLPRWLITGVGVGSVGLAFAMALALTWGMLTRGTDRLQQSLWAWLDTGALRVDVGFVLDPLALVMVLMVSGVGFLIHWFAAAYMASEPEGFGRFFAAFNLFVAAMLVLVLADDLVVLYLGWEGVGLCSYVLIGFWYRNPDNGRAARKAFVMTRVGDAALAIGLFILWARFGTLAIDPLLAAATAGWSQGSPLAVATAVCLLLGAAAKSAQLPLQTWLPDAMAGPTPVSALIHAATMVTAGVYLIARLHPVFLLAPGVLLATALVGVVTLLVGAASALVQSDLKRILAYSTISQIGYMFLALGVGAWSAAIFHLLVHAFFKALLFLAAGVLIMAQHHEADIHAMGGLRRALPLTFLTFVAGAGALAGFPLITAGFFSKDLVLAQVFIAGSAGPWLWAGAALGTLLTALYAFRMVFVVFFGAQRTPLSARPGPSMVVPLLLLAVFAIGFGWLELPATLGGVHQLTHLLEPTLGPLPEPPVVLEAWLQVAAALLSLGGIISAYALFAPAARPLARPFPGLSGGLTRFWQRGWLFDAAYEAGVAGPFRWLARANRRDLVDVPFRAVATVVRLGYAGSSALQDGRVRRYVGGVAIGLAVFLALGIWG